jgi:hypothetical protein
MSAAALYVPVVSLTDWVLALHLLSAAAMAAAVLLFWVVIVAARRASLPSEIGAIAPVLPFGNATIAIGSLGTIGFGIWLAIALDGVKVWDGWVIAAIVLWALASETGRRGGVVYERAVERARTLEADGSTGPDDELRRLCRTREGLVLHAVSTVLVLVILVDMVWKPGA